MGLDLAGVSASLGSACASGTTTPSPTLVAMGVPGDRLRSSVRFSLGAFTTEGEVDEAIARLSDVFCGSVGARRLWLRGQRQEDFLQRSTEITQRLYGKPALPSLHPSLGRYAAAHPENMGYGFAFGGPNHWWKKPFLIWMMRENRAWFRREPDVHWIAGFGSDPAVQKEAEDLIAAQMQK